MYFVTFHHSLSVTQSERVCEQTLNKEPCWLLIERAGFALQTAKRIFGHGQERDRAPGIGLGKETDLLNRILKRQPPVVLQICAPQRSDQGRS